MDRDWLISDLKQFDRETRKIMQDSGALHTQESIKLMYLPTNMGGKGLKQIETLYKLTKIKVANYIVRNQDQRIQLVRKFEVKKTAKKQS